jgi:hypothetical protein
MAGPTQDVSPPCGPRVVPCLTLPAPTAKVSARGFHWWIAPECRHVLLGPQGLRLDEWLEAGQASIVKRGPHRIVYRVELPELHFYVKHNLVPDRLCWVRQLIRPSKARTEYERAHGVAARGVATYAPLALGEQECFLGAGESILITRALDDTQELHLFALTRLAKMPGHRQTVLRQRLASELGKLVARMHDAGIRHNDLHPANVLVRLEKDDRLTLFPIDLNAVRLGEPLSWSQSLRNLVIFNRWFVLRASRTDRCRFWKAYRQNRRLETLREQVNSPAGLEFAAEVEVRTQSSNLRFWQHRDKRCLKNNRYYRRVRSAGVAGHAVVDLDPQVLSALLANPDEPFRRPGVKLLKDSASSTVAELDVEINGRTHRLIYKRFQVSSWTDPWTALLRSAPALRSWVQGQGFRERGLPTARPLAVLHRRRFGLCREGYLLTEKIDGAQDLHEFLANLGKLPAARMLTLLRRQIAQIATVLRELHCRRLSHRDLKAANILVSRDCSTFCSPFSGTAWTTAAPSLLPIFASSVWLIDLVGVRTHLRLSRARRVQNLARLNASFHLGSALTKTDRLRFLRTYLRWSLHGKGDWKSWWAEIDKATQDKVHRNRRRGRPLE